jgi:cysteinyl-tRNA synthetase
VARFRGYGKLSGRRTEELEAGARIAVGEAKEDPLDFTLWKGAKLGEPAWDSKWGPGRPGWHIECSAMSRKYLGDTFDIHAGGQDLVFPHHENEIAQSEGANGVPFANYWMHNGMVNLGGEKMSKSTQHFFLAKEILAEVPAPVVRYYLMSTHYRSPIEFNRDRLAEAGQAYGRLTKALAAANELRERAGEVSPDDASTEIARLRDAFHEAMDDDFNSARAISHLFELAREVNRGADAVAAGSADASAASVVAAADVMVELAEVLGLEIVVESGEVEIPAEVQALFEERQAARRSRDFARADELRDALKAKGYVIEDRPDGSRLVPA